MRAVHGPQHEVFVLQLHGREHVVFVMRPVTGGFVQLLLGQVGGIDVLVPVPPFFFGDVRFELPAYGGAFREP